MAAADVDRDEHARAERLDHRVEEVDVAERRGADDHALGAGPQRLADRRQAAQPAAVLDRHAGLARDPAQVLDRARLAGAGAVEVDDVEEARARLDPRLGRRRAGRRGRRSGPRSGPRRGARPCRRGCRWRDRGSRRRSSRAARGRRGEDFSGWNWTPATFSRSTIEAKRSPYSPSPTTSPPRRPGRRSSARGRRPPRRPARASAPDARSHRHAVPADVRQLRRLERRHLAGQQAEPRGALVLGRGARTAAACRGRCRAPACRSPRARGSPRRGRRRAAGASPRGTRPRRGPRPRRRRGSRRGRRCGRRRAPTCSSAFSTERRLPIP